MVSNSPVPPRDSGKSSRSALTRQRLIAAARQELIERDGCLEVDPVAARAGLSVGSIYRHFGSRAGLIGAVVDDFYNRYRAEALETNPAPGGHFAERERRRTELSVAFHYTDPLAKVVLSSLHLDSEVAVKEAAHIRQMIERAAEVMRLGQSRGEIPNDRDPDFIGAMIIGGMRHVLAIALSKEPPVPETLTAEKLWVLNASIMGI